MITMKGLRWHSNAAVANPDPSEVTAFTTTMTESVLVENRGETLWLWLALRSNHAHPVNHSAVAEADDPSRILYPDSSQHSPSNRPEHSSSKTDGVNVTERTVNVEEAESTAYRDETDVDLEIIVDVVARECDYKCTCCPPLFSLIGGKRFEDEIYSASLNMRIISGRRRRSSPFVCSPSCPRW
jgi:hypothetical protein